MAFHHECQHQELLTYDLQHLLADVYKPVKKISRSKASQVEQKSIPIKGGEFYIPLGTMEKITVMILNYQNTKFT